MSDIIERRIFDNLVRLGSRWRPASFDSLNEIQRRDLRQAIADTAVADLLERDATKMSCGHRVSDLVGGTGTITACGQCIADRRTVIKPPTYKGGPLPNALDGDETPEEAAEKLVGDGDEPALRSARTIIAAALREDRTAMERTTKAIVGRHRAEKKHAESTFDRAHKKALQFLAESNVELEAVKARLAAERAEGVAAERERTERAIADVVAHFHLGPCLDAPRIVAERIRETLAKSAPR